MTPQEFYQLLSQQGIELTDRQKDQFERYFLCRSEERR